MNYFKDDVSLEWPPSSSLVFKWMNTVAQCSSRWRTGPWRYYGRAMAAAVAGLWSERIRTRTIEMALARTIARTAMRKMAAGSLPEGERLLALQAQKRKS